MLPSDITLSAVTHVHVFKYPYNITHIRIAENFRPGVAYLLRLSVKDHYGVPVKNRPITVQTDTGEELSATLDSQGITSLELPMPDDADEVVISVSTLLVGFGVHTDHCFYLR